MAVLTNSEITEIRNSVDIVDIISEFIPLTKRGRNFFCVCPFHEDNAPSMSVSREKQIYKCFGCGASGNVITFLMDYDHMNFKEAMVYLANKSGIKISKDIIYSEKKDNNSKLYEIYDLSTKFYQNNINTVTGEEVRAYLNNRAIDEKIIKEFQIGLALNKRDNLAKLLLNKGYAKDDLLKLGLANSNDYGLNDIFVNRIMFPLWDTTGKVIGYSGRIYNNEDSAKYINTKETPIFKKGMNLYNYHRAKIEARNNNSLIIMEGFMDVIRSYSAGIKNVVALMGTSITKEQINLIKRLSNNIILCLDGDEAGAQATLTCGNELLKVGINPKVIRLDKGLDPDDYIRKYGADKFKLEIGNAKSLVDFKLEYYKKGKNFKSNDDISKYINEILKEISSSTDEIKKDLIINKLSKEFNINTNTLKKQLIKYSKGKEETTNKIPIITKKSPKRNKYEKAEQRLLYYMLKSKEIINLYELNVSYLPTAICRVLANEIIYYYKKHGNISTADFITYLGDNKELIELVGDIESLNLKENYSVDEVDDYIKVLKEFNVNSEIERLTDLIKNEIDISKKVEYAETIRKLKMKE
ncbi:MAG: DNA primase [Bacilli bacterium]|nr:DNA primase [Bacilli bacterium]